MTPGIHLVHKQIGETSFQVVQRFMERIRVEHPGKKLPVCHGGTLDPFAEGLLLLLVGQATRLMDHLHSVPKRYVATVRWGVETDNGDPLGKEVARADPSALTVDRVDAALRAFLGYSDQIPPATSAKWVGGERAYEKAHRGEEVVLPPSRVFLHEARFIGHDLPKESELELSAKGGFYVRSLVRDLGRALESRAHVHALRRTAIGPYQDPGAGEVTVVRGRALLPWCPSREVSDDEARLLSQGAVIPPGVVSPPASPVPNGFPDPQGPLRAFHRDRLVALLKVQPDGLHPIANLRGGI